MIEELKSFADLRSGGVGFSVRTYDPDLEGAVYPDGLSGEQRDSVVKTLIVSADGSPVCAIVPYSRMLHLSSLRKICNTRKVGLLSGEEIEARIGYVIGAISPFGMNVRIPTFIDEQLRRFQFIHVNAGKQGVQISIPLERTISQFNWVVRSISKIKN